MVAIALNPLALEFSPCKVPPGLLEVMPVLAGPPGVHAVAAEINDDIPPPPGLPTPPGLVAPESELERQYAANQRRIEEISHKLAPSCLASPPGLEVDSESELERQYAANQRRIEEISHKLAPPGIFAPACPPGMLAPLVPTGPPGMFFAAGPPGILSAGTSPPGFWEKDLDEVSSADLTTDDESDSERSLEGSGSFSDCSP